MHILDILYANLAQILLWAQATWQGGWDVVTPADVEISTSLSQLLHAQPGSIEGIGNRSSLQRGQVLQQKDQACRQFYVLLTVGCSNCTVRITYHEAMAFEDKPGPTFSVLWSPELTTASMRMCPSLITTDA